jgi:hypothetical protein
MKRVLALSLMASVQRLAGVCLSLSIFIFALCVARGEAEDRHMPKLGSQAPAYVMTARSHPRQCLTNINHRDPCASVTIEGMLFTIAWDAQTKTITYLFTEDRLLVTDSELGVGGGCRLVDEAGKPDDLVQYMGWLVTPKWADTIEHLSGDTVWYAALHRDTSQTKYGKVVGFVQSQYLKIPQ